MRRLALLLLVPALPAFADDAVVGTGTPASCTEAAFDGALAALVPGANAPGGTVTFNCGSAPVTIALTTQKGLGLGYGTAIDGGGRVTLDAGGRTRHFFVGGAESRVEIANLTLTGGRADQGGAMYLDVDTFTSLRNVTLVDNEATNGGGAIFSRERGALAVDDCDVRSNEAPGGGAFALNGPLSVTDSRFALNVAATEGGALQLYNAVVTIDRSRLDFNAAHDGGAILQRGGTLRVSDTSFEENQAVALGGAVHIATNARATLERITARANTATTGGAVFAYSDDAAPLAAVAMRGGSFTDNTATDGGAVACFNTGSSNATPDPCPASDAVFLRNVASARGGAMLVAGHTALLRTTLRENRANDGGGLWVQGQPLLTRNVFEGNQAVENGGAVRIEASLFGIAAGNRFAGNGAKIGGAVAVRGGLGYVTQSLFEQNVGSAIGGGLVVRTDATYPRVLALVTHSTFRNNSSVVGGDVVAAGFASPGELAELEVSFSTLIDSVGNLGASIAAGVGGEVTVRGSIVFPLAGNACNTSNSGRIDSDGANATSASNCGFAAGQDQSFASKAAMQLMPFGDYGGELPGFLPMAGSPLLDRSLCNDNQYRIDQRGKPRPVDGDGDGFALCDAGALERQAIEAPPASLPFRNGFEG